MKIRDFCPVKLVLAICELIFFSTLMIIGFFSGPKNGFAPRFIGFSVYVSNTTDKAEGVLCFKDDNYTLNTIPAIFNTTCFVHGQYVIYFNAYKAGSRFVYYNQIDRYAFNELCELEVYGKNYINSSL